MPKISTANLYDKDIRGLLPTNKIYKKAVGNPKELYIKVYPSGLKIFCKTLFKIELLLA